MHAQRENDKFIKNDIFFMTLNPKGGRRKEMN